ncbi:hypothetical protein BJY01DRAFT_3775 [Aspergillus pseudoustus]|uniref:Uncharacterized protein n=1 Tax=Aspergillus pseudoustus TaxID=1810923 RepID=A0ABR4KTB6_9EURO
MSPLLQCGPYALTLAMRLYSFYLTDRTPKSVSGHLIAAVITSVYAGNQSTEGQSVRKCMSEEGYYGALCQAMVNGLEEDLSNQTGVNIWDPLQLDAIYPPSWFQSTTAKLQQVDWTIGTKAEMVGTIGGSEASMGVFLRLPRYTNLQMIVSSH